MGTRRRWNRNIVLFIVTNLASVACLIWVLRGANIGELRHEIVRLNWRWVAVAMVTGVLVYFWQAWRWNLILQPVQPVSFWRSLCAIYVGLYGSEILPLRAGELIRCYLQAHWNDLPLSVSFASALIERILDGFWLTVCLCLTIRYMPNLPRFIVDSSYILGMIVVTCAGFLGIAMFWRQRTLDALVRVKWLNWAHVLIKDLHLIGHSRYLYFAALVSLPYLVMQTIPIYALLQASRHLDFLTFLQASVIMLILRLSAAVPQAPGNLGTFNVLAVISLTLFHVPRALAHRFSVVLWGGITLPLLVTGFVALAITGVNMGDLHRQARHKMSSRPRDI